MSTYRELIYLVSDELKFASDDSFFNEEHVAFLLNKYRGVLLKQLYKDIKKEVPESNFQTICLDLIKVPAIVDIPCEGGTYLRSKEKIPNLLNIVSPRIYTDSYYTGDITYISRERMRYVGNNKWLQNVIYSSLGPDNYLYFKSYNPQFLYLDKAKMTGVFENPEMAVELRCDKDEICDPWDVEFPIEEALIPQLVSLIVKELSSVMTIPEDKENDANDNITTPAVSNGR